MTGKEPARAKLKVSVPLACSWSTPRQYMVDSVCLMTLLVMCHTACYCYTNQNHRKEMSEAHGQCSSSQARPWLHPQYQKNNNNYDYNDGDEEETKRKERRKERNKKSLPTVNLHSQERLWPHTFSLSLVSNSFHVRQNTQYFC